MAFDFLRGNSQQNTAPLKPWQRLVGMGANMLVPGAGLATNYYFSHHNAPQITRQQPIANTQYGPVGDIQQNIGSYQGGFNSPNYVNTGANTSTDQLRQNMDDWSNQQMQARIQAARQAAGQQAQTPVNQNGRNAQQEAEYAQRLAMQAQMAVDRYSQDIGFTNPYASGTESR